MTWTRVLFAFGIVLLCLAFASAAGEVAVHAIDADAGALVSLGDLLYTLWPAKFVVLKIHVEDLHPLLWSGVVSPLLGLPGWLLFGLPGGALAWVGRWKQRRDIPEDPEEDALFVYDLLARRAAEEGAEPDVDDMAPGEDPEWLRALANSPETSEADFEIPPEPLAEEPAAAADGPERPSADPSAKS